MSLYYTSISSEVWAESFPAIAASAEEIRAQTDQLKYIGIPCVAVVGPLIQALATVGFLRRKKNVSAAEIARLRDLYIKALVFFGLAIATGLLFLLNLFVKPPVMARLPLSIWSVRTELFLQIFFLLACLGYGLTARV